MTAVYCARWVLPISSAPVSEGALVIESDQIVAVGDRNAILPRFPDAMVHDLGEAAIIPGLINTHSHLELTAMRGFLEAEESDFFAWLRKLTFARAEKMTPDDIYDSAAWGACEGARAGVTCFGDSSSDAIASVKALRDVGLRATVYQESFGPDPQLAQGNFAELRARVALLRPYETAVVRVGVSPHAPYTVCAAQLELIADFATSDQLPLMMHAAESKAEQCLIASGTGPFAEGLAKRNIEWHAPGLSSVQYLQRHGILRTRPLLAHCINVDDADIELMRETGTSVAHCPKSNAKLGHGRAPLGQFLKAGIAVGLGSDSVASNNTCDLLDEARFALLLARAGDEGQMVSATEVLTAATLGGARAVDMEGKIGELKVGAQADFVAVSLSGTHQLPSYDPVTSLIFSSSGRDVILTMVAGREVFREGRVIAVDEERLAARMNEIAEKLRD
jgi:5-methylthioadenosine/S-adenosylhomocysteine deaminase